MKFLIVTNDNFDALNYRSPLCEWFFKNHRIQCDIVCPKGDVLNPNRYEIYYFNKRGLSIDNVKKLNYLISKNDYSHIIFRGIESISTFVFLSNKKFTPIFLLTGLGRFFNKKLFFGPIIRTLYRIIFKFLVKKYKAKVIFQNINDKRDLNIKKALIMNGSGLRHKNISSEIIKKKFKSKKIKILTASRLNKSKGIDQIIKLANLIKNEKTIEYFVLGSTDNLSSEKKKEINKLNTYPNIFFMGFIKDISRYLKTSHFSFFPTDYREGSPRFLIESLRSGLIIFTTEMPGCKETISNKNGFSFITANKTLIEIKKTYLDKNKAIEMSQNSINLFNSDYEENLVFKELFNFVIDE